MRFRGTASRTPESRFFRIFRQPLAEAVVNAELSRAWIPLKPEHRWAIEMQKQKRQLFTAIALDPA